MVKETLSLNRWMVLGAIQRGQLSLGVRHLLHIQHGEMVTIKVFFSMESEKKVFIHTNFIVQLFIRTTFMPLSFAYKDPTGSVNFQFRLLT